MATSSVVPEVVPQEIPSGAANMNEESAAPPNDVDNDDLDSSLMSGFSKLQIGSADCPRTFSPIGSERTSPQEGIVLYFCEVTNYSSSLSFICLYVYNRF